MRRALLGTLLLAACSSRPVPVAGADDVVPGMVLVDFEDGTTLAEVREREKGSGVDLAWNSLEGPVDGVAIGSLGDPADDASQLDKLRHMPGVQSVEPLYQYAALRRVNDPDFALQWHLKAIHADEAWDEADGRGVIVAVIDTGIADVPDLEQTHFVKGWNFVDDTEVAVDGNGHGTHVAGTIAQSTDNGIGVAGVAHGATLMPVKVLSDQGSGNAADIADGIRFAVDHGARVLNLSLGGPMPSPAMATAVAYAREHGAVVVCAAGNTGRESMQYPAGYEGAVAVSAIRFDGQLAPYSTFGKQIAIAAPGGDKTVDQNGDGFPDGVLQNTIVRGKPGQSSYEWYQGTSMASPHVAGVAALLYSAGLQTPDEVERAIFEGAATAGPSEKFGHGILDARGALRHARPMRRGFELAAAAALALLLASVSLPRSRRALGAPLVIGLVVGATGLFLLRWLGSLGPLHFVTTPLADWPVAIFGGRPSPLWYSALLPFTSGLMGFGSRSLRHLAAGLSLGFAALLGHAAFLGHPDLAYVPWQWLSITWLGANAFVAFMLGRALLFREAR